MNLPYFLDPAELISLTAKNRTTAQIRVLNAMGIEHKVRPDGSIAVLRSHVEKLFGGTKEKQKKQPLPDWIVFN